MVYIPHGVKKHVKSSKKQIKSSNCHELKERFVTTHRNLGCDWDLEVDLWHVEDLPGGGGVLQRGERLLQVDGGGRHRRDDRRLRLPAEGVLQQPRQLRLPARNGATSQ